MIICDRCKKEGPSFDCFMPFIKRVSPNKERRLIRINLHLCDPCITKVLKRLGHMKVVGTLLGTEPAREVNVPE